jgi:nucleoid-associated protein YgaU
VSEEEAKEQARKDAEAKRKRDARARKAAEAAEAAAKEKAEAEAAAAAKAAAAKAEGMKKRAAERAAADEAKLAGFEAPKAEEAEQFRRWCVRNQITPKSELQARQLFMNWRKSHGAVGEMTDEEAVAEVKCWTALHSFRYYDVAGKRHRVKAGDPVENIAPKDAASFRRRGHLEPYVEPTKTGVSPAAATG